MNPNFITEYTWQGRHDAEMAKLASCALHRLSHSSGELANQEPGVALIGFECDAGVERNKGRVGAKHAPNLIKQALANLAWHHPTPFTIWATFVVKVMH